MSSFSVQPLSSGFTTFDVSQLVEFEVQIQIKDTVENVLVLVFGKDSKGELVAAHRVLNREMSLLAILEENPEAASQEKP